METKIIINCPFNKKMAEGINKACNISGLEELNGFYLYDLKKKFINVGSLDFKKANTENKIINLFTKVDTHETLHNIINQITGKPCNDMEERIVLFIAGQKGGIKW